MKGAVSRSRTPKRRKGGVRQRKRAREQEEGPKIATTSLLVALLVELFSWGEMSPQMVQKISHAAYQDAYNMSQLQTNLEDLKKLSHIGSEGRYPNKCYQEMMKVIPYKVRVPMPFTVRYPFKSPLQSLSQGILWPHELFSALYNHYQPTWRKCIVPSDDVLEKFWENNQTHPAFASSAVKKIEGYQRRVVPLLFHGDDVPITGVGKSWCQQMTVFSWSAMTGGGTTKEAQYFIYGCFEKLRAIHEDQDQDTLGVFFKQLVWSFTWLLDGRWPDRDFSGRKRLVKNYFKILLDKNNWYNFLGPGI